MIAYMYDGTVEPRLTTTSLIRPPRYYDYFFLARQNVHTFSYKNTPLMQPPRLCDQRPRLSFNSRSAFFFVFNLVNTTTNPCIQIAIGNAL